MPLFHIQSQQLMNWENLRHLRYYNLIFNHKYVHYFAFYKEMNSTSNHMILYNFCAQHMKCFWEMLCLKWLPKKILTGLYTKTMLGLHHKINVITVNFCGEGKSAKTFRNRNGLSVAPLWGGALEINSNDTNKNYCWNFIVWGASNSD